MDVKQIRDEIAKIDSLLIAVESELEKIKPEDPPVEEIEAEYLAILSALSNAPPTAPFASLGETEGGLDSPTSAAGAPDAFTFFGLLQAFIDDPTVVKCLAEVFAKVEGVTPTQLEDSLAMADRVADEPTKCELVDSITARIVNETIEGKLTNHAIIATCCLMAGKRTDAPASPSLLRLLDFPDETAEFPYFVKLELAHYVSNFSHTNIQPYIGFLLNSIASTKLPDTDSLISPRMCWQLLHLIRESHVDVPTAQLMAYVERCIGKVVPTIPGHVKQPTDLHNLVIEASRVDSLDSASLWTALVERLISTPGAVAAFEVPGTLAALASKKIYSDALLSNLTAVKKRISTIQSAEQLSEFVDYLVLVGDKSTGASVTRSVLERRDLYIPGDVADVGSLLVSVLELSVISSTETGTIIPESILLLRKFAKPILEFLISNNQTEKIHLLFQVLLPSVDVAGLGVAIPSPRQPRVPHPDMARVVRCLEILGFTTSSESAPELTLMASVDGVEVDCAFLNHKICILVESSSVLNVTAKRHTVSGLTALRANLLSQRKGFKVIIVIPELYPDDKALVGLLTDPLRRVPINSVVEFTNVSSMKLNVNQRLATLRVNSTNLVEVAKVLFLLLKHSITVHHIAFTQLVCGEIFMNQVFSDFLSTFVVKNKIDLLIDVAHGIFSTDSVLKLVEALNSVGNASGGIGSSELRLGLSHADRSEICDIFTSHHPNSLIKVVAGESYERGLRNTVYLL